MTARETTLGALTAADLGKRVRVGGYSGTLHSVLHDSQYGRPLSMFRVGNSEVAGMHPSTTPVTVYDEEEA